MADDKNSKAAALIARIGRTENFYEILEVPRDADDDTIKKAYRKAALRLHPDKCQLEGSKEAFQKLSSAFGCLSDGDERAYYDRTGKERGAAGGGTRGEEVDPDELAREIFKNFFGEDFEIGDNVKPMSAGISFGTGLPTEFQWLFPIILAVFFYFVWHAGNDQPPDFRMSPQGPYTIRRETKLTQSPYFVDASFESYYSSGPKIRKLEKDVDTKYVNHLMSSCRQEKDMRTSLRSKDRKEQVPSCVELEKRGYKLGA